MNKSFIYVSNTTNQTLLAGNTIDLGNIVHKSGCAVNFLGNSVSVSGSGYYSADVSVTLIPTAAGTVSVTLLNNGIPVTGGIGTVTVGATNTSEVLSFKVVCKENCCKETNRLTLVVSADATVSNVAMVVEK